jgi:phosphotransacetylase
MRVSMPLPSFETLFEQADRSRPRLRLAVAGAADRTVLPAILEANRRGWIEPILFADESELNAAAASVEIDISRFERKCVGSPAEAAVAEARAARVALLMKGQVSTPELVSCMLNRETGIRTGGSVGQVVLMEIPRDNRRFLLTDTGIAISPTVSQRLDQLRQTVRIAHRLGVQRPRVALMAASEKRNERMPETVEAEEMVRAVDADATLECDAAGPLSFDLAYAADAGEKKKIGGTVVGAADVMLFPNLLSANLTVKAIMYTADCRFGGVLTGLKTPCVFMSRADSIETRLCSLAFAAAMVQT